MRKSTTILSLVILLVALLGLATQLFPAYTEYATATQQALTYPYTWDYGEGPLLDQTMRLAHFENIYHNDLTKPPYTISNYPPLFLLAQVPFAWIFGPAFWYGRLISILSVIITALLIGFTLYTLTHDWAGALVGGAILIAFPYVQHWSMFTRIDELALVLSWAAVFTTVRFLGNRETPGYQRGQEMTFLRHELRRAGFWAAVLFFVASIYTRQTYALAAPVAAFFWLIFGTRGSWRLRILRAILLGIAVSLIVLLLFVAINLFTQGGFYLNIVTANVNAFFWRTVQNYLKEIQDKLWPLIALTAGFIVLQSIAALVGLFWKRVRPEYTSAWALALPYFLCAASVSITIGKDGSNVNYLLELCAALSLGAGAALAWVGRWKTWWARAAFQLLIIGLIAYQANVMVDWQKQNFSGYRAGREQQIDSISTLEEMIRQTPGIVLADEYMGLVPLAGKQLYFQPFEYKQLAEGKVWDEMPFLLDIANHKFDMILWYQPNSWEGAVEARWTSGQRSMIVTYYKMTDRVGDVYIYRPK